MRRLRKLYHLDWSDRILLVKAWILVWSLRLALWLLPFKWIRSVLSRIAGRQSERPGADPEFPQKVSWAVTAVSRFTPGAGNCLVQALAANFLLKRRGYRSHLRIGVVKDEDGKLDAHAWVECDDRTVIGGAGIERYEPLKPSGKPAEDGDE